MSAYSPETVTFNDGVFDIYACDKYGKKARLISAGHRFGINTLGATRYYAAASAQIKITDLIRIPAGVEVSEENIIVIDSDDYSVKQVQIFSDGNPPYKLLTLNKERRHDRD